MTDGLRSLAGDVMRAALMRFTRSPLSGAITGATSTAILQSSSATTVAAVGFVGAGLISFPEALGIIFGANIGTTITGWLVVLLGFKLKISLILLPVILIGSMLRLFAKGRLAIIGYAFAGFGLIFVGISLMQQGMGGLQNIITPEQFPADTLSGRLKLVLIGIGITVVTQSSSAGIAAALTALFAGAINFNQAAALAIGMDVGTTVTAAMATIGGSIGSRRTGLSHVIYNIFTGIGALIILTPYTLVWEHFAPGQLENNAELALVAFHTTFNTIGVMIILPFTRHFARFVETIISDNTPIYTHSLDKALLVEPKVALTAALFSIQKELSDLLSYTQSLITHDDGDKNVNLLNLQNALDETHAYVDLIHLEKQSEPEWQALFSTIHLLDHIQRLHERCDEDFDRANVATETEELSEAVDLLNQNIKLLIQAINEKRWDETKNIANTTIKIRELLEPLRNSIMSQVAEGKINVPKATDIAEAIRWLKRVNIHIDRITLHLNTASNTLLSQAILEKD